jgi:hypothetical protein
MSEPTQITGTVEKVWNNDRFPKRALVIDGKKYGDYDGSKSEGVKEGDTVSFTFKESGQYLNMFGKATVVTAGNAGAPPASAPAPSGSVDTRQIMIMKQNGLGHAVQYCNANNPDGYMPDQAIDVAKQFLEWYLEK